MSLGHEFYPIDKAALYSLGRGDKGDEPAPIKEPAATEVVKNIEDRRVRIERHVQDRVAGGGGMPFAQLWR